ncbi:MarR family winged helix-turn-helix transcriptional regulator [Luteipulveratus flavus]|uniref:MarR family transcriptional regulator n=1 Tax=Luteipulveratus flavus TaxID=3031728 RepID=A0ABT6C9P3_9MICO|nr:MarR family transcriptional regulator [Luteipulveratus sp. YIM 133296]MDF8265620.1 MarR family transcriptional regulator [Luteipulveratus sp. YIM 133296]
MDSSAQTMPAVTTLVRAAFLVDAVYAESAREHGLTQQQGQLLCVLMARPIGMRELGSMLRLAKSSLTGLVDRTERNGLIRREPDSKDQRAVRVSLTPRGRALVGPFYRDTCDRIERLTDTLDDAGRDALAALLGQVVERNHVPALFAGPGATASGPTAADPTGA